MYALVAMATPQCFCFFKFVAFKRGGRAIYLVDFGMGGLLRVVSCFPVRQKN